MNWKKLKETVMAYVLNREPLPKDPKEAPVKDKPFISATCADQMNIKPNKVYPTIGGLYVNDEGTVMEVVNIKKGIVYYAPPDRCHDGDMEALSCIVFNSLFARYVRDARASQPVKKSTPV